VSDVDRELKELLRRKAEEARLDPGAPAPVLRRARRRRIGNAVVAGLTTAAVVAGAFVGVRVALHQPAHKGGGVASTPTAHRVWLTMNHRLFETSRDTQNTPDAVMQALLAGPTADESGVTVSTAIPAGTELQGLSIENGIARVQLSTPVESDPLSDAQVVITLTQFPDV